MGGKKAKTSPSMYRELNRLGLLGPDDEAVFTSSRDAMEVQNNMFKKVQADEESDRLANYEDTQQQNIVDQIAPNIPGAMSTYNNPFYAAQQAKIDMALHPIVSKDEADVIRAQNEPRTISTYETLPTNLSPDPTDPLDGYQGIGTPTTAYSAKVQVQNFDPVTYDRVTPQIPPNARLVDRQWLDDKPHERSSYLRAKDIRDRIVMSNTLDGTDYTVPSLPSLQDMHTYWNREFDPKTGSFKDVPTAVPYGPLEEIKNYGVDLLKAGQVLMPQNLLNRRIWEEASPFAEKLLHPRTPIEKGVAAVADAALVAYTGVGQGVADMVTKKSVQYLAEQGIARGIVGSYAFGQLLGDVAGGVSDLIKGNPVMGYDSSRKYLEGLGIPTGGMDPETMTKIANQWGSTKAQTDYLRWVNSIPDSNFATRTAKNVMMGADDYLTMASKLGSAQHTNNLTDIAESLGGIMPSDPKQRSLANANLVGLFDQYQKEFTASQPKDFYEEIVRGTTSSTLALAQFAATMRLGGMEETETWKNIGNAVKSVVKQIGNPRSAEFSNALFKVAPKFLGDAFKEAAHFNLMSYTAGIASEISPLTADAGHTYKALMKVPGMTAERAWLGSYFTQALSRGTEFMTEGGFMPLQNAGNIMATNFFKRYASRLWQRFFGEALEEQLGDIIGHYSEELLDTPDDLRQNKNKPFIVNFLNKEAYDWGTTDQPGALKEFVGQVLVSAGMTALTGGVSKATRMTFQNRQEYINKMNDWHSMGFGLEMQKKYLEKANYDTGKMTPAQIQFEYAAARLSDRDGAVKIPVEVIDKVRPLAIKAIEAQVGVNPGELVQHFATNFVETLKGLGGEERLDELHAMTNPIKMSWSPRISENDVKVVVEAMNASKKKGEENTSPPNERPAETSTEGQKTEGTGKNPAPATNTSTETPTSSATIKDTPPPEASKGADRYPELEVKKAEEHKSAIDAAMEPLIVKYEEEFGKIPKVKRTSHGVFESISKSVAHADQMVIDGKREPWDREDWKDARYFVAKDVLAEMKMVLDKYAQEPVKQEVKQEAVKQNPTKEDKETPQVDYQKEVATFTKDSQEKTGVDINNAPPPPKKDDKAITLQEAPTGTGLENYNPLGFNLPVHGLEAGEGYKLQDGAIDETTNSGHNLVEFATLRKKANDRNEAMEIFNSLNDYEKQERIRDIARELELKWGVRIEESEHIGLDQKDNRRVGAAIQNFGMLLDYGFAGLDTPYHEMQHLITMGVFENTPIVQEAYDAMRKRGVAEADLREAVAIEVGQKAARRRGSVAYTHYKNISNNIKLFFNREDVFDTMAREILNPTYVPQTAVERKQFGSLSSTPAIRELIANNWEDLANRISPGRMDKKGRNPFAGVVFPRTTEYATVGSTPIITEQKVIPVQGGDVEAMVSPVDMAPVSKAMSTFAKTGNVVNLFTTFGWNTLDMNPQQLLDKLTGADGVKPLDTLRSLVNDHGAKLDDAARMLVHMQSFHEAPVIDVTFNSNGKSYDGGPDKQGKPISIPAFDLAAISPKSSLYFDENGHAHRTLQMGSVIDKLARLDSFFQKMGLQQKATKTPSGLVPQARYAKLNNINIEGVGSERIDRLFGELPGGKTKSEFKQLINGLASQGYYLILPAGKNHNYVAINAAPFNYASGGDNTALIKLYEEAKYMKADNPIRRKIEAATNAEGKIDPSKIQLTPIEVNAIINGAFVRHIAGGSRKAIAGIYKYFNSIVSSEVTPIASFGMNVMDNLSWFESNGTDGQKKGAAQLESAIEPIITDDKEYEKARKDGKATLADMLSRAGYTLTSAGIVYKLGADGRIDPDTLGEVTIALTGGPDGNEYISAGASMVRDAQYGGPGRVKAHKNRGVFSNGVEGDISKSQAEVADNHIAEAMEAMGIARLIPEKGLKLDADLMWRSPQMNKDVVKIDMDTWVKEVQSGINNPNVPYVIVKSDRMSKPNDAVSVDGHSVAIINQTWQANAMTVREGTDDAKNYKKIGERAADLSNRTMDMVRHYSNPDNSRSVQDLFLYLFSDPNDPITGPFTRMALMNESSPVMGGLSLMPQFHEVTNGGVMNFITRQLLGKSETIGSGCYLKAGGGRLGNLVNVVDSKYLNSAVERISVEEYHGRYNKETNPEAYEKLHKQAEQEWKRTHKEEIKYDPDRKFFTKGFTLSHAIHRHAIEHGYLLDGKEYVKASKDVDLVDHLEDGSIPVIISRNKADKYDWTVGGRVMLSVYPSDSNRSSIATTIVGIYEEHNDAITLPQAIIDKLGKDFDGDKISVYGASEGYWNKKRKELEKRLNNPRNTEQDLISINREMRVMDSLAHHRYMEISQEHFDAIWNFQRGRLSEDSIAKTMNRYGIKDTFDQSANNMLIKEGFAEERAVPFNMKDIDGYGADDIERLSMGYLGPDSNAVGLMAAVKVVIEQIIQMYPQYIRKDADFEKIRLAESLLIQHSVDVPKKTNFLEYKATYEGVLEAALKEILDPKFFYVSKKTGLLQMNVKMVNALTDPIHDFRRLIKGDNEDRSKKETVEAQLLDLVKVKQAMERAGVSKNSIAYNMLAGFDSVPDLRMAIQTYHNSENDIFDNFFKEHFTDANGEQLFPNGYHVDLPGPQDFTAIGARERSSVTGYIMDTVRNLAHKGPNGERILDVPEEHANAVLSVLGAISGLQIMKKLNGDASDPQNYIGMMGHDANSGAFNNFFSGLLSYNTTTTIGNPFKEIIPMLTSNIVEAIGRLHSNISYDVTGPNAPEDIRMGAYGKSGVLPTDIKSVSLVSANMGIGLTMMDGSKKWFKQEDVDAMLASIEQLSAKANELWARKEYASKTGVSEYLPERRNAYFAASNKASADLKEVVPQLYQAVHQLANIYGAIMYAPQIIRMQTSRYAQRSEPTIRNPLSEEKHQVAPVVGVSQVQMEDYLREKINPILSNPDPKLGQFVEVARSLLLRDSWSQITVREVPKSPWQYTIVMVDTKVDGGMWTSPFSNNVKNPDETRRRDQIVPERDNKFLNTVGYRYASDDILRSIMQSWQAVLGKKMNTVDMKVEPKSTPLQIASNKTQEKIDKLWGRLDTLSRKVSHHMSYQFDNEKARQESYKETVGMWRSISKDFEGFLAEKLVASQELIDRMAKANHALSILEAKGKPKINNSSVTKIISGGQLGADMGGLDAAIELGIPTGGTASAGYVQSHPGNVTKSNLELKTKYGLKEGQWANKNPYTQRTIANAQEADGTIWFGNPNSPGGKLTLGASSQNGKPAPLVNPVSAEHIREWINRHNITTLNVAGNREHINPGVYQRTKSMLKNALSDSVTKPTSSKNDGVEYATLDPNKAEHFGKLWKTMDDALGSLYKWTGGQGWGNAVMTNKAHWGQPTQDFRGSDTIGPDSNMLPFVYSIVAKERRFYTNRVNDLARIAHIMMGKEVRRLGVFDLARAAIRRTDEMIKSNNRMHAAHIKKISDSLSHHSLHAIDVDVEMTKALVTESFGVKVMKRSVAEIIPTLGVDPNESVFNVNGELYSFGEVSSNFDAIYAKHFKDTPTKIGLTGDEASIGGLQFVKAMFNVMKSNYENTIANYQSKVELYQYILNNAKHLTMEEKQSVTRAIWRAQSEIAMHTNGDGRMPIVGASNRLFSPEENTVILLLNSIPDKAFGAKFDELSKEDQHKRVLEVQLDAARNMIRRSYSEDGWIAYEKKEAAKTKTEDKLLKAIHELRIIHGSPQGLRRNSPISPAYLSTLDVSRRLDPVQNQIDVKLMLDPNHKKFMTITDPYSYMDTNWARALDNAYSHDSGEVFRAYTKAIEGVYVDPHRNSTGNPNLSKALVSWDRWANAAYGIKNYTQLVEPKDLLKSEVLNLTIAKSRIVKGKTVRIKARYLGEMIDPRDKVMKKTFEVTRNGLPEKVVLDDAGDLYGKYSAIDPETNEGVTYYGKLGENVIMHTYVHDNLHWMERMARYNPKLFTVYYAKFGPVWQTFWHLASSYNSLSKIGGNIRSAINNLIPTFAYNFIYMGPGGMKYRGLNSKEQVTSTESEKELERATWDIIKAMETMNIASVQAKATTGSTYDESTRDAYKHMLDSYRRAQADLSLSLKMGDTMDAVREKEALFSKFKEYLGPLTDPKIRKLAKNSTMETAYWLFQKTEQFNRKWTLSSALALTSGFMNQVYSLGDTLKIGEDTYDLKASFGIKNFPEEIRNELFSNWASYAQMIDDQINFDYGIAARPAWLRGPVMNFVSKFGLYNMCNYYNKFRMLREISELAGKSLKSEGIELAKPQRYYKPIVDSTVDISVNNVPDDQWLSFAKSIVVSNNTEKLVQSDVVKEIKRVYSDKGITLHNSQFNPISQVVRLAFAGSLQLILDTLPWTAGFAIFRDPLYEELQAFCHMLFGAFSDKSDNPKIREIENKAMAESIDKVARSLPITGMAMSKFVSEALKFTLNSLADFDMDGYVKQDLQQVASFQLVKQFSDALGAGVLKYAGETVPFGYNPGALITPFQFDYTADRLSREDQKDEIRKARTEAGLAKPEVADKQLAQARVLYLKDFTAADETIASKAGFISDGKLLGWSQVASSSTDDAVFETKAIFTELELARMGSQHFSLNRLVASIYKKLIKEDEKHGREYRSDRDYRDEAATKADDLIKQWADSVDGINFPRYLQ